MHAGCVCRSRTSTQTRGTRRGLSRASSRACSASWSAPCLPLPLPIHTARGHGDRRQHRHVRCAGAGVVADRASAMARRSGSLRRRAPYSTSRTTSSASCFPTYAAALRISSPSARQVAERIAREVRAISAARRTCGARACRLPFQRVQCGDGDAARFRARVARCDVSGQRAGSTGLPGAGGGVWRHCVLVRRP